MAEQGTKTTQEAKAEVQGVAGLSGQNDANLAVSTKEQNQQRAISASTNSLEQQG